MKSLLAFLLGAAAGGAAIWWYLAPSARQADTARARLERRAGQTGAEVKRTAVDLKDKLAAKIDAFELDPEHVKEDLDKTGQVVRRKARDLGEKVADATADARITAAVKAKLAVDSELSAWDISVATSDGRVTLAGTVDSHAQIGRATALALEVDGVREVVSTLKVGDGARDTRK